VLGSKNPWVLRFVTDDFGTTEYVFPAVGFASSGVSILLSILAEDAF
jgi:hypothetical protein